VEFVENQVLTGGEDAYFVACDGCSNFPFLVSGLVLFVDNKIILF
jgi:hypothetical protein